MDQTQSQQKRAASEEATGTQGKKKDMKYVAQALLPKMLALGGGPPPDQKPLPLPGPKQEKPAKTKGKSKSPAQPAAAPPAAEPEAQKPKKPKKPKTPEAEPAPAACKPEPAKAAPTKKEKKKAAAAASKPVPAEPEPAKASIPVKKDATVKATKATQPAPSKLSMAQLITILSAARAAQKLTKEDATSFQLLFGSIKKNKSDKDAKKQIQNSMRELYKNNIYGKA
jgi:hypothetical protein